VRPFIQPVFFDIDNNVPFDIDLSDRSTLEIRVRLRVVLF